MEASFGFDFSQVRIHADGGAASASAQLGARAFTIGTDIAFGAGEYRPNTLAGDALIAHELAHVVQQASGIAAKGVDGGALEEDADQSAVGAVMAAWGGVKEVSKGALPRLRSGLQLQRCDKGAQPPATAASPRPSPPARGQAPPARTQAPTPTGPPAQAAPPVPAGPPTCVPAAALTWSDFTGTPPAPSTVGAFTAFTFPVISSGGRQWIVATFNGAGSWVRPKWGDPTNRAVSGCGRQVRDCETHFNNPNALDYNLNPIPGCAASPQPDTTLLATNRTECDTVLGVECDRVARIESRRLLRHEQGHFDIACVLANKGNAAIAAGGNATSIAAAVTTKAAQQGALYDTQTGTSCNAAKQADWERDIAAGLPGVTIP
jgi:hypothetical protein